MTIIVTSFVKMGLMMSPTRLLGINFIDHSTFQSTTQLFYMQRTYEPFKNDFTGEREERGTPN